MNWIVVSLVSALGFAIVSVLDKVILTRYIRDARTFIVMVGFMQFVMSALVLPFAPVLDYSLGIMAVSYFSGLLWGFSLITMFLAMSKEDVSRVIPVTSTSPVFVALLAMAFLSENLSAFHWLAILATVVGAAVISAKTTGQSRIPTFNSTFVLLLVGSMAFGAGQFLTKAILGDIDIWSLFILRNAGLGSACLLLMFQSKVYRSIWRAMSNLETATVFVLTEGMLVFIALVITLWAISLGPVSLVVTVMAARPLFVFVMSVILSTSLWRVLDEPLDRKTLSNKLVSTAMIVGGVSVISLL